MPPYDFLVVLGIHEEPPLDFPFMFRVLGMVLRGEWISSVGGNLAAAVNTGVYPGVRNLRTRAVFQFKRFAWFSCSNFFGIDIESHVISSW